VGTPHIYSGGAELNAKRRDIFKHWFIESFQSVGIRADTLSDLRVDMHRVWLETTGQPPLFHDNLKFLKNVSDSFELSIVINDELKMIQLRMVDLLHLSSSDSLSRAIRRFCRKHVAVSSCEQSVAVFAYRWVMEANLY
jgi:hypothetical protein